MPINFRSLAAGSLAGSNTWTGVNSFTNLTTITADVLMSSGVPWAGVRANGGTGDGVTNDSPAVVTALSKLPANGGVIFFEEPSAHYNLATAINLDGKDNILFAGNTQQASPGNVQLRFPLTGAGSCISAKDCDGLVFRGLQIVYTSTSFTGDMIDLGHTGGESSSGVSFEHCFLGGIGSSVATARSVVLAKNTNNLRVIASEVGNAQYGIIGRLAGADFSNGVSINGCNFLGGLTIAPFHGPGTGWSITDNIFEPLADGTLVIMTSSVGVTGQGLHFTGNWIGDATAGGALFDIGVTGMNIQGNYITYSPNGFPGTLIKSTSGGLRGLNIQGNYISVTDTASAIIDFAGAGPFNNIDCSKNYIAGFTAGNAYPNKATIEGTVDPKAIRLEDLTSGSLPRIEEYIATNLRYMYNGTLGKQVLGWGHSNNLFRNALGVLSGQGHGFVGLGAEHSGTANTLKNDGSGTKGFAIVRQTDGSVEYQHADAATADAVWGTVAKPFKHGPTNVVGFHGATPVGVRTLGAAASDPATTQALANALRQAMIDYGLGTT